MRLTIRQRLLYMIPSYDVFDEDHNWIYSADGKFDAGSHIDLLDSNNNKVAEIIYHGFSVPFFDIFIHDEYCGQVKPDPLHVKYIMDYNGWTIKDIVGLGYRYTIRDKDNNVVTEIKKSPLNPMDTYTIDIDESNVLPAIITTIVVDYAYHSGR